MPIRRILSHLTPFFLATITATLLTLLATILTHTALPDAGLLHPHSPQQPPSLRIPYNILMLLIQTTGFIGTYLLTLRLLRVPELSDALTYLLGRFRR